MPIKDKHLKTQGVKKKKSFFEYCQIHFFVESSKGFTTHKIKKREYFPINFPQYALIR